MKKLLAIVLSLFSILAFAQGPNSMIIYQMEPGGQYLMGRWMNPASSSGTYMMLYNGSTAVPGLASLDSSLTWNGTTLAVAPIVRSFTYPVRTLNTCFQVSATRDALLTYTASISTTLSLTTGQQGTIHLRTFTNNLCTTGQQEVSSITNGQTGSLSVGLNLIQSLASQLRAVVPAGAWVELVSENIVGTPTYTWVSSQEILL